MFAKAILVGAFAALAAAQSTVLSFTKVPSGTVQVGEPQVISYTTNDPSSPVTILLRQGPSTNLQTISTLTSSSTGGDFTWTPSTSLVNGDNYALQITQGDQVNYSGLFAITGGSASSSSSTSTSASSSSSSASVSSSSLSASGYVSSSSSAISTITASYNATAITTATVSAGTGISVSRNTTMSRATLAGTGSASATGGASTSGAGYQGTQTASGSPVISTGGAASFATGSSALALVFGAVAAVLFC